jgi:hypothetical protein
VLSSSFEQGTDVNTRDVYDSSPLEEPFEVELGNDEVRTGQSYPLYRSTILKLLIIYYVVYDCFHIRIRECENTYEVALQAECIFCTHV